MLTLEALLGLQCSQPCPPLVMAVVVCCVTRNHFKTTATTLERLLGLGADPENLYGSTALHGRMNVRCLTPVALLCLPIQVL